MFNNICVHSDQDYIHESKKYNLELFISFENFKIARPKIHENNGASKIMFPQEARLRNFTYSSNMTVDLKIKYVIRGGVNLQSENVMYKVLENIYIGKLPIMLKSSICILKQYKHVSSNITGECEMDAGGYFIINGSEKTCLGQERAAENQVQCFNCEKNNSKWSWLAEIKSVPDFKCISPKQISMMISSKNNGVGYPISIQIPRIKTPVPLFILFRALGIENDKQIIEYIVLDIDNKEEKNKKLIECIKASVVDASECMTKDKAIDFIKQHAMYTPINMTKEVGEIKKMKFTKDVLDTDYFLIVEQLLRNYILSVI